MKKYYDDRKQLNMEISDAKDGSMRIKLHQPNGIKEITVTELKVRKSSNLIALSTTIITVKLVATFHLKLTTHTASW